MVCCGKVICSGCIHAVQSRDGGGGLCPFCRTPPPTTDEEMVKRYKKRMELNDEMGIYNYGCMYRDGEFGLPQNVAKALELWHRAAELGYSMAYGNIGYAYLNGIGVEMDKKRATHYYELAAMGGSIAARCNLGCNERQAGNVDRALKHWMIAVKDGGLDSLENIKRLYGYGHATKDDYTEALRSYQAYLDEVKSDQREEAAAR